MRNELYAAYIYGVSITVDKYQKAVVTYEKYRHQIAELTKAIDEAANWYCTETHQGGPRCSNSINGQTCISAMWEHNKCLLREGWTKDEIAVESHDMKLCPSCTEVNRLVSERKEAKQQFGIAKRRLSQIGKALINRSGESL